MTRTTTPDVTVFSESLRDTSTLRFITCGSVDDGKSTLIGRLLHESKSIFDDQRSALTRDSTKYGTQGENIDFALLVDGLLAEREQGITIDVAYCFFSTTQRKFIVADTPGHLQYTRNMATGASTADLAVILIDARKGLLTQTRRHARIVSMMGVRHVVLAINKMDLVNFDAAVFRRIEAEFAQFSIDLNFRFVQAIPISALEGDNITTSSQNMSWYCGPPILEYLANVNVSRVDMREPVSRRLRLPVQCVIRPDQDFRGVCGRLASGTVQCGDKVRVLPAGAIAQVKEIFLGQQSLAVASTGESITLTFTDDVDISRGNVIVAMEEPPEAADQFEARLLWMSERAMMPGRPYLLKLHCQEVSATITDIKYCEDVDTGAHLAAKSLALNEIGVVNLSLSQPVVFEHYSVNRTLGGFILIDKLTFETIGAGMIEFALRRASNIHWQALEVNKQARASIKHQTARCIWFTGLSGAGKSTIANLLEKRLHAEGKHTCILDGDNLRHGLNRDLGFTEADRVENIRRVGEVAKLMVDAGLIVLVSFISPYRSERRLARSLFAVDEFVEVYVDAPLDTCEARDTKGLYAKARRGELKNFTGIDSEYQAPEVPEVHLLTATTSEEDCIALMWEQLR
ncbi:MAG: sulfate adenylyltransferase subunit CysN [Aeromicrobium sp.]|nr:sulfate adenylyltransferase subunit CysN [Burkholderiales bacterium]